MFDLKDKFTRKWLTEFIVSLVKKNSELKKAKELKATGDWGAYKPYVDKCVIDWLEPLMVMGGVKYEVKGRENIPQNEPIIFTPNHAGLFDIPAMILNTPKPTIFLSKVEAQSFPVIGKWMDVMDCVFVDRKNKTQAHSSLQSAIDMVKAGRSITIYPEGTRSKNGIIGKFKGGAMKIAMETGVKVVPVVLDGTRERLDETGRMTPGTIYVTFLPAIETKGLTKDDFFAMPDKIRDMIDAEREKQRAERIA